MERASPAEPSRIAPIALALGVSAVFALWLDFSSLHALHDGDSLVPIFVSLERWTVFFWGQNRFGMLLPLLALPVRDPLANLLVQTGLRLAAVAGAMYVLAAALAPRRLWLLAGTLSLVWLVLVLGLPGLALLQEQPYPQEVVLGLGGCLLIERAKTAWARIAGALAVLAAAWISLTLPLWLIPLLALRRVLGPREIEGRQRTLACLASVAASFAASVLLSRFYVVHGTDFGVIGLGRWPDGARQLWAGIGETLGATGLAGVLLALVAAVLLARRESWLGRAVVVSLLAAAALVLLLAASAWVAANGYPSRYGFAALALLVLLPALSLTALLDHFAPARGRLPIGLGASAALVAALLLRVGWPSPSAPLRAWELHRSEVEALRALGCTHLVGDYWRVWPTTFAAAVLPGRASAPAPWALSYRSLAVEDLWRASDWTQATACGFADDRLRETWLPYLGLRIANSRPGVGSVEHVTLVEADAGLERDGEALPAR